MPPIWVHFGLSLVGCASIGTLAAARPRTTWLPWVGYGLVVGAVGPDTDLILSSLATALAGFDTSVGKDMHRTFTHSFAMVALLALLAAALWRTRPRLAPTILGAALGVGFLHILPDLFYLVPVKPWSPFSFVEVGPFGPINKHNFSDAQNNVINGIDFLGESATMMASWWLMRRAHVTNRFAQLLPWLAGLNAAIFLPLTIWVAPHATYDAFLVWVYAPGLPFIVIVTIFVPWLARAGFLRLAGQPPFAQQPGRGGNPA